MPKNLRRYKRLLGLYPASYRKQYGDQMVQTLEDMLEDADNAPKRAFVWMRVATDFPISLAKAQLHYAGSAYHSETPDYIKQSGLLTAILVLPFFLALIANGLDKVMYDQTLYHSWLWRLPYLGIWVLWLPSVALLITLLSYLRYISKPGKTASKPLIRRMFDITHAWPVMVPGVIALGILFILAFHDSAQCWVQNPVHFVTKFHQTLVCTEHGSFGGQSGRSSSLAR